MMLTMKRDGDQDMVIVMMVLMVSMRCISATDGVTSQIKN